MTRNNVVPYVPDCLGRVVNTSVLYMKDSKDGMKVHSVPYTEPSMLNCVS